MLPTVNRCLWTVVCKAHRAGQTQLAECSDAAGPMIGSSIFAPLEGFEVETRTRDDEAACKFSIMKDLLERLKASEIDPERVLAEKSLQGISIYDWRNIIFARQEDNRLHSNRAKTLRASPQKPAE